MQFLALAGRLHINRDCGARQLSSGGEPRRAGGGGDDRSYRCPRATICASEWSLSTGGPITRSCPMMCSTTLNGAVCRVDLSDEPRNRADGRRVRSLGFIG